MPVYLVDLAVGKAAKDCEWMSEFQATTQPLSSAQLLVIVPSDQAAEFECECKQYAKIVDRCSPAPCLTPAGLPRSEVENQLARASLPVAFISEINDEVRVYFESQEALERASSVLQPPPPTAAADRSISQADRVMHKVILRPPLEHASKDFYDPENLKTTLLAQLEQQLKVPGWKDVHTSVHELAIEFKTEPLAKDFVQHNRNGFKLRILAYSAEKQRITFVPEYRKDTIPSIEDIFEGINRANSPAASREVGISDKKVIALLGPTQAGKTTFTGYIAGCPIEISKNKHGTKYIHVNSIYAQRSLVLAHGAPPDQTVTIDGVVVPAGYQLVHKNCACDGVTLFPDPFDVASDDLAQATTKHIFCFPLDDDVYVADTPGTLDTEGLEVDVYNAAMKKILFDSAKSVGVAFFLSWPVFTEAAGQALQMFLTTITSFFTNFRRELRDVGVVITRMLPPTNLKNIQKPHQSVETLYDEAVSVLASLIASRKSDAMTTEFLQHVRQNLISTAEFLQEKRARPGMAMIINPLNPNETGLARTVLSCLPGLTADRLCASLPANGVALLHASFETELRKFVKYLHDGHLPAAFDIIFEAARVRHELTSAGVRYTDPSGWTIEATINDFVQHINLLRASRRDALHGAVLSKNAKSAAAVSESMAVFEQELLRTMADIAQLQRQSEEIVLKGLFPEWVATTEEIRRTGELIPQVLAELQPKSEPIVWHSFLGALSLLAELCLFSTHFASLAHLIEKGVAQLLGLQPSKLLEFNPVACEDLDGLIASVDGISQQTVEVLDQFHDAEAALQGAAKLLAGMDSEFITALSHALGTDFNEVMATKGVITFNFSSTKHSLLMAIKAKLISVAASVREWLQAGLGGAGEATHKRIACGITLLARVADSDRLDQYLAPVLEQKGQSTLLGHRPLRMLVLGDIERALQLQDEPLQDVESVSAKELHRRIQQFINVFALANAFRGVESAVEHAQRKLIDQLLGKLAKSCEGISHLIEDARFVFQHAPREPVPTHGPPSGTVHRGRGSSASHTSPEALCNLIVRLCYALSLFRGADSSAPLGDAILVPALGRLKAAAQQTEKHAFVSRFDSAIPSFRYLRNLREFAPTEEQIHDSALNELHAELQQCTAAIDVSLNKIKEAMEQAIRALPSTAGSGYRWVYDLEQSNDILDLFVQKDEGGVHSHFEEGEVVSTALQKRDSVVSNISAWHVQQTALFEQYMANEHETAQLVQTCLATWPFERSRLPKLYQLWSNPTTSTPLASLSSKFISFTQALLQKKGGPSTRGRLLQQLKGLIEGFDTLECVQQDLDSRILELPNRLSERYASESAEADKALANFMNNLAKIEDYIPEDDWERSLNQFDTEGRQQALQQMLSVYIRGKRILQSRVQSFLRQRDFTAREKQTILLELLTRFYSIIAVVLDRHFPKQNEQPAEDPGALGRYASDNYSAAVVALIRQPLLEAKQTYETYLERSDLVSAAQTLAPACELWDLLEQYIQLDCTILPEHWKQKVETIIRDSMKRPEFPLEDTLNHIAAHYEKLVQLERDAVSGEKTLRIAIASQVMTGLQKEIEKVKKLHDLEMRKDTDRSGLYTTLWTCLGALQNEIQAPRDVNFFHRSEEIAKIRQCTTPMTEREVPVVKQFCEYAQSTIKKEGTITKRTVSAILCLQTMIMQWDHHQIVSKPLREALQDCESFVETFVKSIFSKSAAASGVREESESEAVRLNEEDLFRFLLPHLPGLELLGNTTQVAGTQLGELKSTVAEVLRDVTTKCLGHLSEAMKRGNPTADAESFAACAQTAERLQIVLAALNESKFFAAAALQLLCEESDKISGLVNEVFSESFLTHDPQYAVPLLEKLAYAPTARQKIKTEWLGRMREAQRKQEQTSRQVRSWASQTKDMLTEVRSDPSKLNKKHLGKALTQMCEKTSEGNEHCDATLAEIRTTVEAMEMQFCAQLEEKKICNCMACFAVVQACEKSELYKQFSGDTESATEALTSRSVESVESVFKATQQAINEKEKVNLTDLECALDLVKAITAVDAKTATKKQKLVDLVASKIGGSMTRLRDKAEQCLFKDLDANFFECLDDLLRVGLLLDESQQLAEQQLTEQQQEFKLCRSQFEEWKRQLPNDVLELCRSNKHAEVAGLFSQENHLSGTNNLVLTAVRGYSDEILRQQGTEPYQIFQVYDALDKLKQLLLNLSSSHPDTAKLNVELRDVVEKALEEKATLVERLLERERPKLYDHEKVKVALQTVQRFLKFPRVKEVAAEDLKKAVLKVWEYLLDCAKARAEFIACSDIPEPPVASDILFAGIAEFASFSRDLDSQAFLKENFPQAVMDCKLETTLQEGYHTLISHWQRNCKDLSVFISDGEAAVAAGKHLVATLCSGLLQRLFREKDVMLQKTVPSFVEELCNSLRKALVQTWDDCDMGRSPNASYFQDTYQFVEVLAAEAKNTASYNTAFSRVILHITKHIESGISKELWAVRDMFATIPDLQARVQVVAEALSHARACCVHVTQITNIVNKCLDGLLNFLQEFSSADPDFMQSLYTCLCKSGTGSAVAQRPCFKEIELGALNDAACRHTPEITVRSKMEFDPKLGGEHKRQLIQRLDMHAKVSHDLLMQAARAGEKKGSDEAHKEGLKFINRATLKVAGHAQYDHLNDSVASLITHISIMLTWVKSGAAFVKTMDKKKLVQAHNIQLAAIYRLLGLDSTNQKCEFLQQLLSPQTGLVEGVPFPGHLIEILTGEGKSITLAILGCTLALVGLPVDIVCYNSYLTKRDEQAMDKLRTSLQLRDKLRYMTFHEVLESRLGDMRAAMLAAAKDSTQAFKPPPQINRVLLIDEADVLFDWEKFFGHTFKPVARYSTPSVQALIDSVFSMRSDSSALFQVKQSQPFRNALAEAPDLAEVLHEAVGKMCSDAKKIGRRTQTPTSNPCDYVVDNNKGIGYFDSDGTINFDMGYGFKSAFALCAEASQITVTQSMLEHRKSIPLPAPPFSFAQLPLRGYLAVFGVTGTLRTLSPTELGFLRTGFKIEKLTFSHSVYERTGEVYVPSRDATWKDNEHDWRVCIAQLILKIKSDHPVGVDKGWPIVVVWEDSNQIQAFLSSPAGAQFKRSCRIIDRTVPLENINDIVENATLSGQLTMVTREFGRGVDFKCRQCENLTVIQTFLSVSESEETQIRGRTARQGQPGTYKLIVCGEHVVKTLSQQNRPVDQKGLKASFVDNQPADLFILRSQRRAKLEAVLNEKIATCRTLEQVDAAAWKFMDSMFSNSDVKVKQQLILQISRKEFSPRQHYVLMLDQSGSMSHPLSPGRSMWQALVDSVACIISRLRINCNPHRTTVTFIPFTSSATATSNLLADLSANPIAHLSPNGGTLFSEAFKACAATVRRINATEGNWQHRLLFLTDGADSSSTKDPISQMFRPTKQGVQSLHRILYGGEPNPNHPGLKEMRTAFSQYGINTVDVQAGDESTLVQAMNEFADTGAADR